MLQCTLTLSLYILLELLSAVYVIVKRLDSVLMCDYCDVQSMNCYMYYLCKL